MSEAVATEKKVQPKTFYSRGAHLGACINQGFNVPGEGGVHKRIGEKHLTFTPATGEFGMIITDDAEKIEFIEKEIEAGNLTYLTPQQFAKAITPKEVQIDQLERSLAEARSKERQFEMSNQLMADLKAQNPEMYNKLMKGRQG